MPVSFGSPVARSSTASLASVIASLIGRPVRDRRAQRLDRGPATRPRRRVAAHAVGDREQREPVVDDVRVLVVVAHAAGVGERAGGELHRAPTSSTVSPTCTRSPLRTRAACATCLPFTNVPFVEPRSSMQQLPVALDDARVHLRHERVDRRGDRAAAAATDRRLAVDPTASRTARCRAAATTTSPALAGSRGRRRAARPARGHGRAAQLARRRPTRRARGTGRATRAGRT